jgi:signal transduction histidine kinase
MIPNDEKKSSLNQALLDAIFGPVGNGMQVLQIVRGQKAPADFKYLLPDGDGELSARSDGDGSHRLVVAQNPELENADLLKGLKNLVQTGEHLEKVLQYGQDGTTNWVRIKAQKFGDDVIITKEDLTQTKEAEERLMQLNRALFAKNRELEALSSELKTFNTIVANDYNDTLRNLYTSMEFIVSNDARNLSDAGKANVRRAQAAIQKLKLLTEDIVAFSRISTEEPLSPVDLNEVIASVINSMQRKIKENVATVKYKDLPVIQGYQLLVTILFTHLIDNAIKFRKQEINPRINIEYTHQEGKTIDHSSANKDLSYDIISVVDNGIGFDIREGEKIFTMFYRLHEKGKTKGGIGLAICKKIMDLHGGFISSECTPECTTFRCYFPREKLIV